MKSTQYFGRNKKGVACLNCGAPLRGDENFCPECGQVNDELPLSIKQFVSEFFAGFLSFDSRFFNTLIPLLVKPGKVSKEYINGKRRKYTNPFKLYLHTSIIFFLLTGIISSINTFKKLDSSNTVNLANKSEIMDSIITVSPKDALNPVEIEYIKKFNTKLDSVFAVASYKKLFNADSISKKAKDSLYAKLYSMGIHTLSKGFDLKGKNFGLETKPFNARQKAVTETLKQYFSTKGIHYTKKEIPMVAINRNEGKIGAFYQFSSKNKDMLAADALDSLKYPKSRWNIFLYLKTRNLNKLASDKAFQRSYLKAIVSKISMALFFLLPVFTLLFSLLYIRHSYRYTEHLVVVFNIQTVFFMLLILGILQDLIFKTDIFSFVLTVLFVFYVYKTLRNFYHQGRLKTLTKFFIISFGYFIIANIGFLVISFLAFII